MLRRSLLRTLAAGWLSPWMPRALCVGATDGPNAALNYRQAFAWAKPLKPEDSERLRNAATIAIDDPRIDIFDSGRRASTGSRRSGTRRQSGGVIGRPRFRRLKIWAKITSTFSTSTSSALRAYRRAGTPGQGGAGKPLTTCSQG